MRQIPQTNNHGQRVRRNLSESKNWPKPMSSKAGGIKYPAAPKTKKQKLAIFAPSQPAMLWY